MRKIASEGVAAERVAAEGVAEEGSAAEEAAAEGGVGSRGGGLGSRLEHPARLGWNCWDGRLWPVLHDKTGQISDLHLQGGNLSL